MTVRSATLGLRWRRSRALLAMVSEGASLDQVTGLLSSDGTSMLRELMQGYVDRCAEQEPPELRLGKPQMLAALVKQRDGLGAPPPWPGAHDRRCTDEREAPWSPDAIGRAPSQPHTRSRQLCSG